MGFRKMHPGFSWLSPEVDEMWDDDGNPTLYGRMKLNQWLHGTDGHTRARWAVVLRYSNGRAISRDLMSDNTVVWC